MNSMYKPTVWADGDTITADKLNKMELGIHDMYENSEPLIVTFKNGIGDKSTNDVINAFENGRTVLFDFTYMGNFLKVCTLKAYSYIINPLGEKMITFYFNSRCDYLINVSGNRLTCENSGLE